MSELNELPAPVWMDISDLRLNDNNPRVIKDDKFMKLVKSLQDFPEMIFYRPIVVNVEFVILGGNMRYRAAREAGMKQVPVLIADNFSEAQQYEFIIKDNVSGGEWDFDALANDWSELPLEDWGLDLPVKIDEHVPEASEKQKAFKLEIVAESENDQDAIYEKLRDAGYDIKKK